jgi:hypothetical protein
LQRYFVRLELDRELGADPPEVFGRFEADQCRLWVGDVPRGPTISGRKRSCSRF